MQKRSYLWHVTEPLESQPSPLCTPRPPDEPYPTPMPRPLPMPERAWLSSTADATRAGIILSGPPRPRSLFLKQQQQQQQPVLKYCWDQCGQETTFWWNPMASLVCKLQFACVRSKKISISCNQPSFREHAAILGSRFPSSLFVLSAAPPWCVRLHLPVGDLHTL